MTDGAAAGKGFAKYVDGRHARPWDPLTATICLRRRDLIVISKESVPSIV
jgi:hypothetical protein